MTPGVKVFGGITTALSLEGRGGQFAAVGGRKGGKRGREKNRVSE